MKDKNRTLIRNSINVVGVTIEVLAPASRSSHFLLNYTYMCSGKLFDFIRRLTACIFITYSYRYTNEYYDPGYYFQSNTKPEKKKSFFSFFFLIA